MSLLNRKRYQPRPLYDAAQLIDGWPGEAYDGTSVSAGLDIARMHGLVPATSREAHIIGKNEVMRLPIAGDGIAANRWALNMDDVLGVLGRANQEAIPFLNSWGTRYPHITWMPVEVHARLMGEDGEYGIITDR